MPNIERLPIIRYFSKPIKFDFIHYFLNRDSVKILDIGCGNHSPSLTKFYYPTCVYYGIDKSRNYNLNEEDFRCMEKFYEIDLSDEGLLSVIPDKFFDCIIFSHVIEHLPNGVQLLEKILQKLKQDGVIYIEFPSKRSARFPRMKGPFLGGTLNFYDDPTHIKLVDPQNVEKVLMNGGCVILSSGLRHSLKKIFFFPFYFIYSIVFLKRIDGGLFWDILGFANYFIAQKK